MTDEIPPEEHDTDEQLGERASPAAATRMWGDRWIAFRPGPVARRGQGAVWKVRDARDATTRGPRPIYALKEMLTPRGRSSPAYRRFAQEIETTSRLAGVHPGIVPVVDYFLPIGDEPGMPYYVMPWAEWTLERARFLAGPDALERVLRMGIRLADALGACHSATPPVIHRDVKPANVLLVGEAHEPQLADLGICFLQDEERTRLTGTEAGTLGSAGFTAPELLGGGKIERVGPPADVYSLGKTLYAVVAGGDLFPRESHRAEKFDLAVRYDDLRLQHLHGLLDYMVAEDPARRYPTMTACREQLARAVANLQRGIQYTSGMYGAGELPRERTLSLRSTLNTASGLKRSDAVHAAVDRSLAAARDSAVAFERENPSMRTTVGQPHAGGLTAATEIAEHLLSAALPLVEEDERDVFDEWLGRAREMSHRDGYRHAPQNQVAAAGAVAAIYGAAAAAWLLRRDGVLAQLVDAHLEAEGDWIHLELLERSAGRLLPWVQRVLESSELVASTTPRAAEEAANAASVFPGLVALKDLQASSAEVQALIDSRRVDEITMSAYPMCYYEGAGWAKMLAEACSRSKARERSIGEHVFGLAPEAFREHCRRATPVLAAWTNRLNREISRNVSWRFSVDGEGVWKRWCGGEPQSPR